MNVIAEVRTPQLKRLHSGKVRDSFRIDAERRLIVVTDRISAFDLRLSTPVPQKGEILNRLAAFWFSATRDVVPNHLLESVSEQASIVREAAPIRVEMIVRGYMAGSMARGYASGKRAFSGAAVEAGLTENGRLATPIVTPTTKEDSDREITPDDLVREGLATRALYDKMAEVSLELFRRGSEVLRSKGLLLADTKYEFGLVGDDLVLIDEIHTPDSSRIWDAGTYAKSPKDVPPLDKEFVRAFMLKEREKSGAFPLALPEDVIDETRARYVELFRRITGHEPSGAPDPTGRLYEALVAAGHIKPGFVVVCMGSPSDIEHAKRVRKVLANYGVRTFVRVVSAHKNGERIEELADSYNGALEPGAVVAIAGESNGLGGALAANLELPVVNAPPYGDKSDLILNLQSSLMMPSNIPATTAIRPENAALAALRSLNLRHLKARFSGEIREMKVRLIRADETMQAELGADDEVAP